MSKIDFVKFLPVTYSEKMAKKVNYQYEKQLETQLRGIEREEKFTKNIIEKSSSSFQKNMQSKWQKANQSCLRYYETNDDGLYYVQLNRKSRDDMFERKFMPRLTMMYNNKQGKEQYFHRRLTRSKSDSNHTMMGLPTPIPKRLAHSFESHDENEERLIPARTRSATVMDAFSQQAYIRKYGSETFAKENETQAERDGNKSFRERQRSSTLSDLTQSRFVDDIKPDRRSPSYQETQKLERLPQPCVKNAHLQLRRKKNLCRAMSLPESQHSPRTLRNDDNDKESQVLGILPMMKDALSLSSSNDVERGQQKPGDKLKSKASCIKRNNDTVYNINAKTASRRYLKPRRAWCEAEDALMPTPPNKPKLRSTKSL